MQTLEKICSDLKLDTDHEAEFDRNAWAKFLDAQSVRAIRSVTRQEAYLCWLLVRKYQPEVVLELGGQHGHSGLVFLDAVRSYGGKFVTVELGNDPRNNYDELSAGTLQFLPDAPDVAKVWGDAVEELPRLLANYKIGLVFHDCAHTWDHVEACVKTVHDFNPSIIQTCHDAAQGMWQPEVQTHYGVICAERPVFDKYFLDNPAYYYTVFEDKYGVGLVIPKELI